MSLFRKIALVKITFQAGELVKGRWTEGEETREEFLGTWQPASGQDLLKLPDGKRHDENFKCFAPIDLDFTAADSEKGISGDRIEHDGKRYEVFQAAKWNNRILPHWELMCVREKEGEI